MKPRVEKHMTRGAVLVAAALFAAPLFAQEEIYLYVRHRDAAGESARYKLKCLDASCRVETKTGKREVSLTTEQRKGLLDALQAETKQLVIAADPAAADEQTKVKLRYATPMKRLEIERRMPAGKPVVLTPEMLEVIKTHLDLDLSKPVLPGPAAADDPGAEPTGKGQAQ